MPHHCNLCACNGGAGFSLPTPACGRIFSQLLRGRLPRSRRPNSVRDTAGGGPRQKCYCERMSSLTPREANSVSTAATPKFEPVFTRGALFILIALLLGETTVNFIDRQVVSVLAPVLRAEFHLSNGHYAAIVNAFMGTYALALPFAGWVLDRLGVGRGLTLAVSWWSAAGMLTALVRGPLS